MQRFRAPGWNFFPGGAAASEPERAAGSEAEGAILAHGDWNMLLGKGHVSPEMYPAKYSFDPGAAPDCTNDFVVFGLATPGTTGAQANLVAFNNLYSGAGGLCGAAPSVYFAYNTTTQTGGKIVTSPVLSSTGKKIAFVESLGTSSILHVLTWTPNTGGITSAAPPTMTSLTYSSTATTTTSAPYYDYGSDTLYVADDSGIVYKITGVFNSTPALAGSPWPVTVASGTRLTPPVLDTHHGFLLIGGRNGNLYEVNLTNGAVSALIVGVHGGTNSGVLAPPLVDVTNGTAFAISSNDGTTAVLVQADTTTMLRLAKARIGQGSATGNIVSIFLPAVSNAYFTSPASGEIYTCGTGVSDATPWQYSFGFTGRTMQTVPAFSGQLVNFAGVGCTPWTEFFNPNVGSGTDFFFFGLTADCTGNGTSGCVASRTTTTTTITTVNVAGGPSGIVVDNYSTAAQASSIYLTAEKANTAYKFTQNGLH